MDYCIYFKVVFVYRSYFPNVKIADFSFTLLDLKNRKLMVYKELLFNGVHGRTLQDSGFSVFL